MATEADVLDFLRDRKRATLAEVAEALNLPRYGRKSAWSLLDSLREKGLVEKRGDFWIPSEKAAPEIEVAPGISPEVKTLIEVMARAITTAVKGPPVDEWELARKPMEAEIEKEREAEVASHILKPDLAVEEAKKELVPFVTGTFLDQLFLDEEGKPLGGIPSGIQLAITGLPGAGKSLLVEEIAIRAADAGKKTLFVTAEDTWKSPGPRYDLQSRLIRKAELLKLDWDRIARNLFIMDTVACPELRDWTTFAETYRYVAEREGINLAIFDSVTVLESYRGALKYRVMELCRFNQLRGITAIYVNQRSAETWDTYDMAGGIGLAHNLDGTVIIDYGRVYWLDQQVDLQVKRGEFVRIARVLDCRLCNFDRRRHLIDITPDGFVRLVERPK